MVTPPHTFNFNGWNNQFLPFPAVSAPFFQFFFHSLTALLTLFTLFFSFLFPLSLSFFPSSPLRSSVEESKSQLVSNEAIVEESRAAVESNVKQLPDNVETFKTEYAAKSKRRFKDVSKSISSTVDVVDDVNTQVSYGLVIVCAFENFEYFGYWPLGILHLWNFDPCLCFRFIL